MSVLRPLAANAFRQLYGVCERFGVQPILARYDSPVPSTRHLTDALFQKRSECVGLSWNLPVQEHYLTHVFPKYATEAEFHTNPGLSLVDSAILHAMIRWHKPLKIVEIGSGASTQIAARACILNQGDGAVSELVAIEPQPQRALKHGFPGLTKLIEKKVQDVSLDEIIDCDLLFIDSSHVVKTGGDVTHEILEIVPRLKPGALVHWHDILLPGEYWKDWVKERHYFWTEQYLLHAFLQFNDHFEVLWASRYMHLRDAAAINAVFPYFQPASDRITSFWVRRKG